MVLEIVELNQMKNMRKCLLFSFLLLSLSSIAQTPVNADSRKVSPFGELSNQQRYGIDYELVDYTFVGGDSSILDLLDLNSMEYMRHDEFDQVYRDQTNHVMVLLYSRKRIKLGVSDEKKIEEHN